MFVSSRTTLAFTTFAFLLVTVLVLGLQAFSQPTSDSGTPISPPLTASSIVQPALADIQNSVSGVNISRWKAPNEVRSIAQQNASSILRDLTGTLPALLGRADASGNSVSSSFSVYRNIDALYDVLLRLHGTAVLAAPQEESDALFFSLQKLEATRTQLGDAIFNASQDREAQLVKLQSALKAAASVPAQAAPPQASVVEDGPAATPPVKKKKKPAAKPPAASSGTTTPPTS
jgi:hypothetical protein